MQQSRSLLDTIKAQLDANILTLDPNSISYKAVQYTLNIWVNLCRYLYYADASIDNNVAERAVRLSKLGMKNWLFIGHPNALPSSTPSSKTAKYTESLHRYLQDALERDSYT